VLAGGESTRLRSLTRALHGEEVPKQFATIQHGVSLLQMAVARARRWSRAERIIVVVDAEWRTLAEKQLSLPGFRLVAQPRDLGTAPGLLLALAHVMECDPAAQVTVLPADLYVRDEPALADSVQQALASARAAEAPVLIGTVPYGAETECGWIVAAPAAPQCACPEIAACTDDCARSGGCSRVESFVEKPARARAQQLLARGALWNTAIMVGAARGFRALAERHLPRHSVYFERLRCSIGTPDESELLQKIYGLLAPADFSRDVLQLADGLRVVALAPCGWSDWATPERVLLSLRGTSDFASLVTRLKHAVTERTLELLLAGATLPDAANRAPGELTT
jgi:mannose-1-phosphate guanylyltransferase